eukprot:CAMPEP_0178626142 /NCGR_PEP_ID=MMETSP0698-20121128/8249_1 /TAXON_ID=265572 /ORGANISM="Extubocellulus spinifer, Strain CCMP396" /LENGTH=363 /DNA_ID=CAMNT_0020265343 /DNA_START=381 /DNA_END=1468 /DNA_ORIENTATION=+
MPIGYSIPPSFDGLHAQWRSRERGSGPFSVCDPRPVRAYRNGVPYNDETFSTVRAAFQFYEAAIGPDAIALAECSFYSKIRGDTGPGFVLPFPQVHDLAGVSFMFESLASLEWCDPLGDGSGSGMTFAEHAATTVPNCQPRSHLLSIVDGDGKIQESVAPCDAIRTVESLAGRDTGISAWVDRYGGMRFVDGNDKMWLLYRTNAKGHEKGSKESVLKKEPWNSVDPLKRAFLENPTPSRAEKEQLVKTSGLTFDQVGRWYRGLRWKCKNWSDEEKRLFFADALAAAAVGAAVGAAAVGAVTASASTRTAKAASASSASAKASGKKRKAAAASTGTRTAKAASASSASADDDVECEQNAREADA